MNDNPILDDLKDEPVKKNGIRPLAIILEVIPFLLTFFGFQNIIFFAAIPICYLLISWYIFKASTFKLMDIILAELAALIPIIGMFSIIFELESWEGAQELTIFTIIAGFAFSAFMILRYFYKKEDPLEYRFSLKIFSRLMIYTASLIYALFYLF